MSEATTSITNATSDTTKTVTIEAATGEAMRELGKHVARLTRGGDIILLSGPLGAGKTTFAQGFGAGLNISEPIVSPTFTIARELEGQFPNGNSAHLIHVDAYRLGGNAYAPGQNAVERLLDELESLGLDENSKTPATTPSSSWNGANKWLPHSHRNASKSTSTGHSTPTAQTQRPIRPATNSPATAYAP